MVAGERSPAGKPGRQRSGVRGAEPASQVERRVDHRERQEHCGRTAYGKRQYGERQNDKRSRQGCHPRGRGRYNAAGIRSVRSTNSRDAYGAEDAGWRKAARCRTSANDAVSHSEGWVGEAEPNPSKGPQHLKSPRSGRQRFPREHQTHWPNGEKEPAGMPSSGTRALQRRRHSAALP